MTRQHWTAIVTCLAAGGWVMALILCGAIGFGLNTMVGKEALYTALVLQAAHLGLVRHWKGTFPKPVLWVWRVGAGLLLLALILGCFRLGFGSPWVRWPCLAGTLLAALSWPFLAAYCKV